MALSLSHRAAASCDIALVLAMDVSGSVDAHEYQLQVTGVADALRDGAVTDALVAGQVAVSIVQWSGALEQSVAIPWARMTDYAAVAALATRTARLPRSFAGSNTAVGEAIAFSVTQFDAVRDCAHHVIDVSGDGDENEGYTLRTERRAAWQRGIVINGLAIEAAGVARPITNFYNRWVVTPGGFVITASQHDDFARAILEKLRRELVPPIADTGPYQGPELPQFSPQNRIQVSFHRD